MPSFKDPLKTCKGGMAKLDSGEKLTPKRFLRVMFESSRHSQGSVRRQVKDLLKKMESENWKLRTGKPGQSPDKLPSIWLELDRTRYMLMYTEEYGEPLIAKIK